MAMVWVFGNQITIGQNQWRNDINCAHNCHIHTNQTNNSLTMSTTSFVCFNPYCNSRLKCFANEKGYTMHFELSPSCFQYFCEHNEASLKPPAGSPTVGRKRNSMASYNATFTTTKRASLLRHHMVNDVFTAKQDTCYQGTEDINDSFDVVDNDETDNAAIAEPDISQRPEVFPFDPFMFTTDQKWTIALLKLLDDMNAPDYAFKDVLLWARDAQADGYSFYPDGGVSRMRSVDLLFKAMTNAKRLLPSVTVVSVPHGPPQKIITYEFAPQLLHLLQNPKIMTTENLLIDLQNPLVQYQSPNGELGDALSGSVYRNAYSRLITNPAREFFVPIIQWIDRTHITGDGRFSLKPYMFTPAIFTETFRRRIQAWGYHGFLPKSKKSSAQNKKETLGNNMRNYHAQLYAVLQSFTTAGPRLKNVLLPIGPHGAMRVDIVTCILFIIQDMQEGDALCGRYGTHGAGIQRHCRGCNVDHADLDNPNVKCSYLMAANMAAIASNDDLSIRKKWSQHFLNNAFDHVPLADPVRGIFGATPIETMHAFRKGLVETVTYLVLDNVPASKKAAFDTLAVRFHTSHRQTIRKAYPSSDFSNGVTNLSRVTATERIGLVFLFVILAQYDEGWNILQEALDQRDKAQLFEVINVFECMLCLDEWMNQHTFWNAQTYTRSKRAAYRGIVTLMEMCRTHIPLSGTSTWKFPKFHELLHVLDDMERFGAPVNFNAQRPESLLIFAAKQPGRRAQKRHEGCKFELQSAQRLSYSLMIDTMHTCIWDSEESGNALNDAAMETSCDDSLIIQEGTGHATFGRVIRDELFQYQTIWQTSTHKDLMVLPRELMQFLVHTFGLHVCICTEYVREEFTFRCHPNYQSNGPIFDWMNVMYEHSSRKPDKTQICPCRLAAVVVNASATEPYQLVVQCASTRTGRDSVLFQEWHWSQTYSVISPSTIAGPCFVVSITDDCSTILQTKARYLWPAEFIKPIAERKKSNLF